MCSHYDAALNEPSSVKERMDRRGGENTVSREGGREGSDWFTTRWIQPVGLVESRIQCGAVPVMLINLDGSSGVWFSKCRLVVVYNSSGVV